MTRKYNSQRRAESAERTRQAIVEAAVKMHQQGVTTLSAVAEEAGVSLPTVNKYFPTREDLFGACTTHVAAHLDYPSPDALAAIDDAGERLSQLVQQVFVLHETTFGTAWTGYRLEDESQMMAEAMANYEHFIGLLVDAMLHDLDHFIGDKATIAGFVRAALSPLTYRALRLRNGLDQADAARYMTVALSGLLGIGLPEAISGAGLR